MKKHNSDLYNTLLYLSRNLYFYSKIKLKDNFETRIYLMFMHFSTILIIFKKKNIKYSQKSYDGLFFCIENNLRELGFGDVAVNTKMKNLNKVFYDILLKLNTSKTQFETNKNTIRKYFSYIDDSKYKDFDQYFLNFYHFCFVLSPQSMIKEALKFKV